MLIRTLLPEIKEALVHSGKIIILYGPRQVGKTTLINQLLSDFEGKTLKIDADQLRYNDTLASRDLERMRELIGDAEVLFIDEAQQIQDIGINLKILHDNMPSLKIIATGSSSFELANSLQEPLTGRTRTFRLFPIHIDEVAKNSSIFEAKSQLQSYLRFGMYPEVLNLKGEKQKRLHLRELTTSYLYKDVLSLTNIKHSDKIHKLLRMLSFQVGSLVSINELASNLGMSQETVGSYIDLLEKGFVLFRLTGFSRNLRKEISKKNKIYFYDLGVRNILIDKLEPLEKRNDIGALWENFLIVERRKKLSYTYDFSNSYFWRTYNGSEIDYVEESGHAIKGFEFKYSQKKPRPPKVWLEQYPDASFSQIDRENYWEFVT